MSFQNQSQASSPLHRHSVRPPHPSTDPVTHGQRQTDLPELLFAAVVVITM